MRTRTVHTQPPSASPRGWPLTLLLVTVGALGVSHTPVGQGGRVELPVVPIRLTKVVAAFDWTEGDRAFALDGAALDGAANLAVRQEIILPGILLEDPDRLVLVGLPGAWALGGGRPESADLLLADRRLRPGRVLAHDRQIGLLLVQFPDAPRLAGQVAVPDLPDPRVHWLCLPDDGAFRLHPVRLDTQLRLRAPAPPHFPLAVPVFSAAGRFVGLAQPDPRTTAPAPDWRVTPADEIATRVRRMVETGRDIVPGYLGLFLTDTPGPDGRPLTIVRDVVPGSPSARAGVQAGDRITGFDGLPRPRAHDLVRLLRRLDPGRRVALELLRQEQFRRVEVELAEPAAGARPDTGRRSSPLLPPDWLRGRSRPSGSDWRLPDMAHPTLGVFLRPRDSGSDNPGVVVTHVWPGLPAAAAGLRAGDVLLRLGGRPVRTPAEFSRLLTELAMHGTIPIDYLRDGQAGQVSIAVHPPGGRRSPR